MEPKERRSSTRRPIKLAAQLALGSAGVWPCQIADFCAEGLFIRYSGETSRQVRAYLDQYPGQDLGIVFRTPDGRQRHQLNARPARVIDGAMGVEFTQSSPEAIEAMLSQCGADGQYQERSALKPPSDKVQFILHQCARTVIQHIEPLMEESFRAMVEDLRQAALKAPSDQQANEYMDAAGQVEARQRSVWLLMSRSLESPLKPVREGAAEGGLSLVDKGEFEDWLTLKVMVTKADTQYRGELLQLRMRLDQIGITNATGHQNPLGPSLVCDAFHTGLDSLKASRAVERVCLRTFESQVLQKIGPLYEDLNQILIRQGVLPDLDLSRYLSERPSRPAPARTGSPKAAEAAAQAQAPVPEPKPAGVPAASNGSRMAGGFSDNSQAARSAFATVRNLLGTLAASRTGSAGGQAPLFDPGARPLSAGEFQKQLQSLQLAPAPVSGTPLKERVVEEIKGQGDHALDEEQQATLDVVDRFFRSVSENPKLSPSAQQQLRQLEVPVLKVVLRDREFFDDHASPVRGVLNRLAQLGVKGGRVNPLVQRRIDELIGRINNEFEQDTRVFEGAVTELDALIDRQNLVYRRNVERVTAAAEGAQKVAESKAAVARALAERIAGRRVPRALVSLLDAGWRDLLSLTWIRLGPESPLWQDYLAVVDSLLSYGEDPDSAINLSELLRVIQEGLASISSNHLPSSQIRDELRSLLVRKPGTDIAMVTMPGAEQPDTREDQVLASQNRRLQRWIARAQKLRTGDWMRDQETPDQVQYIRLVWVARGFSRFVFVNHQGMRVVELSLEELASQMQQGIIVPDGQYEQPLVDESIDRMVRKVYDQLSWASTHDELTGLLARREFERMLEQQLSRREDPRSLVRLDLRQFRVLNDRAGYSAGDEALKTVAGVLRNHVEEGMPLARLAGAEFGFLLPTEQAESVTGAIIHAIEELDLVFEGQRYALSASAGVAPEIPELTTAERWLRAADEACKAVRPEGDGNVLLSQLPAAEQDQQSRIAAKVESLGDLDAEQVLLRCQKIIPLHRQARLATQYEVLISMYDDNGGLISAMDFVRMAERYNRMQAVDRWVVGHMLDWLRDAGPAVAGEAGFCINLSGYSLNDESLLEFIYHKLSEKDAPIERLWFEITEAAAINDLQSVAEFIGEMQELGCRFCLGNFGAGPKSYQYMRSLPVDMIKLDGAFARQLHTSDEDQAMVRAIVDMAHYLKREVIASGVEHREALELLRQLGIDYAQGYAIEKPRLLSSLGS